MASAHRALQLEDRRLGMGAGKQLRDEARRIVVNTLISRLSEPVSSPARWVRLRPVLASMQGEAAGEAAPTGFDCE
jgi:hypothetical protein